MRRSRLGLLVAAVLAAVVGLCTAGSLAVVTTHGISMEPRMSQGDLVVVRAAGSYAAGDVVAYRSALLDSVVLHRIVGIAGDGFVVRGDNNSWDDAERPSDAEVIGKELLHLPRGGIWLQRLTAPPVLAAAGFLLVIAGGTVTRTRAGRRKEHRMSPRHRATKTSGGTVLPAALKPLAAAVAAVAVTAAALAALTWAGPLERPVKAASGAESTMGFSYEADVPESAAYDGTTVTAPQPVFRSLTDDVVVTYRYNGPRGSLLTTIRLATDSGWTTTLAAGPPAAVRSGYEGSTRLDLDALQLRARAAADVTGLPSRSVSVFVVPSVTMDDGGTFAPELELTLDDHSLRPVGDLTVTGASSMTGTTLQPARLSALGLSLDVATARKASLLALVACALAAVLLVVAMRLSGPVAEAERVRRRHGDVILPVLPVALTAGRPLVDVPDVASLVRLAERYGLLVLTWSRGGVDTYVVQDEGATYRCRSWHAQPQQSQPLQVDALTQA